MEKEKDEIIKDLDKSMEDRKNEVKKKSNADKK